MANKWDKYKIVNYKPEKELETQKEITPDIATQETKVEPNRWEKYKVSSYQPIMGNSIASQETSLFGLENIPKTEETISQRPSMVADLIQDPTTFQRFKEHPLGTALRTLMGGAEMVEGTTADIALGLQKGKPQEILPNIAKTLRGEKPAQLGDVFRGIGLPEPMSATLGLLASGGKYMPTELFSGGVMKGASKITQLPKLLKTFGQPVITKSLSVLSGIPENDVVKAVNNPNILSKRWLNKEKIIVDDMYNNVIQPAIRNLKNKVKTSIPEVEKTLKEIQLDVNSQPTRLATTMKTMELDNVQKWIGKLNGRELTLNETDALIGEMDLGLQKFYKAKEKAKLEPITKTYEMLTLKLRNALKSARDKTFPELADKFQKYSDFKNAERIYEGFDRWQPKLLNMALAGTIAGPLGQALGLPWATVSSLTMGSTVPKLQAGAIQLGSQLGKEAMKSSAIPFLGALRQSENK